MDRVKTAEKNIFYCENPQLKAVTGVLTGPWSSKGIRLLSRTVIFARESYWIVFDEILGQGGHEISFFWNLLTSKPETINDNGHTSGIRCHLDQDEYVDLTASPTTTKLDISLETGLKCPLRGWISKGDRDIPCHSIIGTTKAQLPFSLAWVIFPYRMAVSPHLKSFSMNRQNSADILRIERTDGKVDEIKIPTRVMNKPSGISMKRI